MAGSKLPPVAWAVWERETAHGREWVVRCRRGAAVLEWPGYPSEAIARAVCARLVTVFAQEAADDGARARKVREG